MIQAVAYGGHAAAPLVYPPAPMPRYDAYFGLGHLFSLRDNPNVFRVSTAGLAFGYYLLRGITERELRGRILDLGTGSGVQALLLRGMGARQIVATDISPHAVVTAKENEIFNFGDSALTYCTGNLFDGLSADARTRFDLIIFNPPGWRTPSDLLKSKLQRTDSGLDLSAMFYGDDVLVEFLTRLPDHLEGRGRAIVGLNSLVGIADVMRRAQEAAQREKRGRLTFKLLERIEIPLLFYTPSWQRATSDLLDEFERWRQTCGSAFSKADGQFKWYYEITEVTVS